ncbi:MAG: chemotaxis response regulator protein-glutamate methylesterase [Desulfobacteraceae bacterium 4572_88]|nr:MAG: chemotaxis response regulator protein-glutamate methylesterase [Desulfobacteraceae bacterium 4572_88]
MKKIKVLVVDDSAVTRQTLREILMSDTLIEDVVTASDPLIAAKKIMRDIPDVIVLDVEMPRMDGLTFLRKIMSQHPIPVVMCSALTQNGCETTLRALEYGAVDIITKPRLGVKIFLQESGIIICDAVKAAARARIRRISPTSRRRPGGMVVEKKLTADVVIPPPTGRAMIRTTEKVVAVGASTGGTEALRIFLEAFPMDAPGIVIVQHMPEHFTRAFSDRLNTLCRIEVKEAENGDSVLRGRALIGPGNKHILLKRSGARYYVEVRDGPLVCRHRPSVDVLFRSAARYAGSNAVGAIMTGMGDDGARGMLEMKEAGASTIAQDEASCVVFGMPNEAIKRGAADRVLSLESIAPAVLRECSG